MCVDQLEMTLEACLERGVDYVDVTASDESTLWRSWNKRFTRDLRETVKIAARTILIKAQNANVAVPREPERSLLLRGNDADESDPDTRAILDNAETIIGQIREMYRQAFRHLIDEVAETEEFFRAGIT